MSGKSTNKIPDESRIASLLGQFNPHPSTKFQVRMSKAPWVGGKSHRYRQTILPVLKSRSLRFAAVVVTIALTGIFFIPSVRGIARQIYYSFINSTTNQMEVEVQLDAPTDLFDYSDPSGFSLSIEEVEKLAGFDLKEIYSTTGNFEVVGSKFDPTYSAAITLYQDNDYKLFLTQRQIHNGKDVFSIGSDAQVEIVWVGKHQGEFVAGGWKAISSQVITKTLQPGSPVTINAVWDNSLAQYTLRWQSDGYAFELRALGEGSPEQSELLSIANGLK